MAGIAIDPAGAATATQPQNADATRVLGMDTVRAFAALSVMFAHILGPGMPDLLRRLPVDLGGIAELSKYTFTGHPAVTAFFVVSGFCIHYPYVKRPLPILAFWAARWIRIMTPALVALLAAKFEKVTYFNFWDGYILWSLVCELFYYTLYPLFIWLSRRVGWFAQFFISLVVSYVVAGWLGSDQYGNPHVFGPFLNWLVALPCWLAGCVLAESVVDGRYLGHGYGVGIWRAGVALTASVLYWLTLNSSVGFYLTLNIFSILVLFWLGVEIHSAREFGANKLFEKIGRFSFSIYLFHIIAFAMISRAFHIDWNGPKRLAVIPFVLAFCYLMYVVVEKPSHLYARKLFARLQGR